MKIDKNKLLKDIEEMKVKLAAMEEQLKKPDEYKHFPSKGDEYYFYTSSGSIHSNESSSEDLKVNVYKTEEEADKAYNKEVAIEKIKRRLLELQGDWKPDWKDQDVTKVFINYYHHSCVFEPEALYFAQSFKDFPYMKNKEIANTIIEEMEDELKLLFDIT